MNGAGGTVGGGASNIAGLGGTVAGGAGNNASGVSATIGGGNNNVVSGDSATVAGGADNRATATRCNRSVVATATAQQDLSLRLLVVFGTVPKQMLPLSLAVLTTA